VIYTTNAVESLNMSLRKGVKTRGSFPNAEAAIKLLYLAWNTGDVAPMGSPMSGTVFFAVHDRAAHRDCKSESA
jgi:transposase-like protein